MRSIRLDDARRTESPTEKVMMFTCPERDFIEGMESAWKLGYLAGGGKDTFVDVAWGMSEMRALLIARGYEA
ncbi:hypothetical protein CC53_gp116 [Rhizobium phage vB_RleS_L338C]|uniref:hypothetical protein n=1 Tax=Rhizobium phage vB_RleS_L338C TaxID=1414737 RepID=UPI0003D8171E|nr:hypothetical protein CC53_gp116 [Rhizobium phage vB_RleS_L338C]AHC30533.1 hypothetical protein L338C_116 [Rhizobium phage vB_RleS_L338C]QNH72170.1 hypothetical protein P11VFA_034 [Rhizobium phage P11VFA]